MKRKYLIVFLSIIGVISISWGSLIHRTIHQLAVYQLPKPMQSFFHENMKYLVENAPRPDTRRNTDSSEAPRHFIDLEAYGDSAAWKMPMVWETAISIYSIDSLLEYGYVPYHIMTMQERLTKAFRKLEKDSILFYAVDLAHYIGDANVPLHTTLNYDGQLTNQHGLHSLWESMIPEIHIAEYKLYSDHKAKYISDPAKEVWACIRRAHKLLPGVFGKEVEATKEFTGSTKYRIQVRRGKEVKSYTSAFAKTYNQKLGQTINQQLLYSVKMIGDFWYTAWVDAGRPDLSSITLNHGEKEKEILKSELKAYRKNELLKKDLLLSKKDKKAND